MEAEWESVECVWVGGGVWSAEAGMLVYGDKGNNALSHQDVQHRIKTPTSYSMLKAGAGTCQRKVQSWGC